MAEVETEALVAAVVLELATTRPRRPALLISEAMFIPLTSRAPSLHGPVEDAHYRAHGLVGVDQGSVREGPIP